MSDNAELPIWSRQAAIQALQGIIKEHTDGLTLRSFAEAMRNANLSGEFEDLKCSGGHFIANAYGIKGQISLKANFNTTHTTIENTIKGVYNIKQSTINAIFLFLNKYYVNTISQIEKRLYMETNFKQYLSIARFYNAMPDAALGALTTSPTLLALAGTYALYQPFHLNPYEQVLVARFTVGDSKAQGVESDPSRALTDKDFYCEIESRYTPDKGKPSKSIGEGHIVPISKDAAIAVLQTPQSLFSILFNKIHKDDGNPEAIVLSGIFTAVSGGETAGWAISAVRCEDENFPYAVLSKDEIPNLHEAPQESLSKGSIFWRRSDFPGFDFGNLPKPNVA